MTNTYEKDIEEICSKQFELIEEKKLQIWDLEEENRIYLNRLDELAGLLLKRQERIDDLERWCSHLQGIIDKNEDKSKRVDELEAWCGHLQAIIDQRNEKCQKLEKRYGIFFKVARKLYRIAAG